MVGVIGFEPTTPLVPNEVLYQAEPHSDISLWCAVYSRLRALLQERRGTFLKIFLPANGLASPFVRPLPFPALPFRKGLCRKKEGPALL